MFIDAFAYHPYFLPENRIFFQQSCYLAIPFQAFEGTPSGRVFSIKDLGFVYDGGYLIKTPVYIHAVGDRGKFPLRFVSYHLDHFVQKFLYSLV